MKEITITSLEEGQRLDRVLGRYLAKASTGFIYKMLRKKNITLNGKKAEGKEKLSRGDVIRLYFAEETLEKFTISREKADWPRTELDIVYEDEQVLLVNKSAGMLTQKAAPSDVSLNEYAIGYLLDSGSVSRESLASFRPSVCNRLDYNTSGIVAVGKTTAALQELSEMFRERTIHKYYQALVYGRVEEAKTIEGYLVKDESRNRVRILSERQAEEYSRKTAEAEKRGRKPAESEKHGRELAGTEKHNRTLSKETEPKWIRTRYVPVGYREDGSGKGDLTLLEIELMTGRSHQIRAHLSSIGHAVVGDPGYGNGRNAFFRRRYGVCGQLLHAGRIVFTKTEGALGYLSGREFTAKLPEVFERVLREEGIKRIP